MKRVFRTNYADHRLIASMLGNLAVYAALTDPGDRIMSLSQPFGGHSSNRSDGPAGVRGLTIYDVPMDPRELAVDLEVFGLLARKVQPKLVVLGASMTLFPFPLKAMADIASEWGGRIIFDGAHQLGLIAGGQFQDPLREGACVLTGSAGKTFSGPQIGIIVWDDPTLTPAISHAIFPTLVATHQVNRVAALAVTAAEFVACQSPWEGPRATPWSANTPISRRWKVSNRLDISCGFEFHTIRGMIKAWTCFGFALQVMLGLALN